MKHYTDTISKDLYNKLVMAGMPQLLETYAEVFDWLMSEKGLVLHIWASGDEHTKSNMVDIGRGVKNAVGEGTWHEATTKAIEKALELI